MAARFAHSSARFNAETARSSPRAVVNPPRQARLQAGFIIAAGLDDKPNVTRLHQHVIHPNIHPILAGHWLPFSNTDRSTGCWPERPVSSNAGLK